jgi:hypothetical protein
VVHHLADPAAGLRALRDVLAPEGAVQLMIYARFGRFGIDLMRDYSRRLGLGPTADDIEGLRETLREVPLGHPISHLLRETPDLQDAGALADALLNPRERAYTVQELFDLLTSSGFQFARWVRQAPYRPQCGVMARLPHGEPISRMDDVEQYAAMELFRGTMARHNLIAYRDDSPLPALDWEAWRSYIPMIPPTVVMIEERLPPGMAAAVINRAHVDTDLVCFLTADEVEVFSRMNGRIAVGEIQGASPAFLERLWRHDLVVIDASGPDAGVSPT